jgi:hypothetical protein
MNIKNVVSKLDFMFSPTRVTGAPQTVLKIP